MISDYLSKEERFSCIKTGALSYAAMLDADNGPQVKEAQIFGTGAVKNVVDAGKSLWLLAALGAGIPLGVFSHVMGRRVSGKRLREEELKEKIRLYQTAADEMASGLSEGAL